MLPFPEPQNILEKSFGEQLELNPPLSATNSYFPFSPPQTAFIPDSLHDFLLFPAVATGTNAFPHPLPPSLGPNNATAMNAAATVKRHAADESSSRKRTSRKDRHSKIYTASGPRDRRMRLSLDVARKFFDLQDMLGFDKASKTVQWLLNMSKAAIKELAVVSAPKLCNSFSNQSPTNEPYASEGEDASSISDSKGKSAVLEVTDADHVTKPKAKRSANKPSKKAAFHPMLKKESRDQARARARERTREKKRMCLLSASIPFDAIDEEPSSQNLNSSSCEERYSSSNNQYMKLTNERSFETQMADGSGLTPILDHSSQNITSMNDAISLFEQWDMERILLADVQFYPRSFENFNNSFSV